MPGLKSTLPAGLRRTEPPQLRLLGPVGVRRAGRGNPPWSYAKLPALLALLGDAGGAPVARDWAAALLWPQGDAASLRRALYDLRRQLRDGRDGPSPVASSRQALWLHPGLACDLGALERAWRAAQAGRLDMDEAARVLALWDGDFASGLAVPGADDFELWLLQARARWQQRALSLALTLAAEQLRCGQAARAVSTAGRAVERVPDADAAHAMLWRCLQAAGQPLLAVQDWRRHLAALAGLQLAPSKALCAEARALGLERAEPGVAGAESRPIGGAEQRQEAAWAARTAGAAGATGAGREEGPQAAAAADDAEALALALQQALRQGPGGPAVQALLQQAEARLQAGPPHVLLLRRAFTLRLMHSPWQLPMARLAAGAEALLCTPLADAERLDVVQPLATWHGWMGRGIRGEVLLRTLGDIDDEQLPAATRVRHQMTLALCHSCSTGDPERSIRAARRALRIARAGAVPGCAAALALLVANAALNRDAAGDAGVAERALAQALQEAPLQRFDAVNHHQLSAQWQLAYGSAARALAEAEQGASLAVAVPFPLQQLSCALLAVSARMTMGDNDQADALAAAELLARRIGSQGYLMNALFVGAALARRQGDAALAAARCRQARAVASACGAQRIRKIPPTLLHEALAAEVR